MSYRIGKGKPPKHTQFKRGVSGNPEGARNHDPLKKLFKATRLEIIELIKESLCCTEEEMKAKLNDPSVSVAQQIIGKTMLKAAKRGDWPLMNSMITQVLGKPQ